MKKFTLLLCLFVVSVMMPQWAYATDFSETVNNRNNLKVSVATVSEEVTLTVESNEAGTLKTYIQDDLQSDPDGKLTSMKACTKIVLKGKFNSDDIGKIAQDQGFTSVKTVNMTDALFFTNNTNNTNNFKLYNNSIPSDASAGIYSKAIQNAVLYQSKSGKSWQTIGDPGEGNATQYDSESAWTGSSEYSSPSVGQRATFPNGEYMYVELTVSPTGWSAPKVGAPGISGYYQKDWEENSSNILDSHVSDIGDQDLQVEIYRYYKIVKNNGTKSWQRATISDWNAATANANDSLLAFIAGQGDATEATLDNLADHLWFDPGTCIRFSIYYDKVFSRLWNGDGSSTEQSGAREVTFDYNYRSNHISDFNDTRSNIWVKMPKYAYREYKTTGSYTWNETPVPFVDGEEKSVSQHSDAFNSLTPPNADGLYAVVSTNGSNDIRIYSGSNWVLTDQISQVYDYAQVKFEYWKDKIETAYLPSYVDPAICPSSVLQNCTKLTKLYKDEYYAQMTDNSSTVEVEATAPNLFKLLLNTRSSQRYVDGTLFKFTSSCVLSAEDLVVLTDDQNIKYYVDLYDIPTGEGSTIETVITDAINTIRTSNDKQFKGLLLPNNPINIGTLLIQDTEQNENRRIPDRTSPRSGRYFQRNSADHGYRPDKARRYCKGRYRDLDKERAGHSG